MIDFATMRRRLNEYIAEVFAEEDENISVTTGWVLIAETVTGNGERQLTVLSSDALGDRELPIWSGYGWLKHVADDPEYFWFADGDGEGLDD